MNLESIIEFLTNLEKENIELKKKILELETTNNKMNVDLGNMSKVSMISNMDKQLKEKTNTIQLLESQLEKINRELKEKNMYIYNLEKQIDSKHEKITIKDNDYFVIDNNVYDILDGKPNIVVGTIKNNKVKFIKK